MTREKQLIDKFGRKHDYLRISLIERCNLRCVYCMPEEGVVLRDKREFMRPEEIISIARQFVELGVTKIRLTGGEPLLRKGADQVIKALSELPVELTMTTNAVLIDKYIDLIVESKLRSINVSLDSLNDERFKDITRRDQFDKVLENIDLLLSKGIELKINVVLMKGTNEDEIIDFILWAEKKKVEIRFIEFMPFDGNKWSSELKISEKEIVTTVEKHFGTDRLTQLPVGKNATSRKYIVDGTDIVFGVISTVTNPFCDSCNRIRLTADGKIKNCLFSQSETDLLTALREGSDIVHLIEESVFGKAKSRGGYGSFDDSTAATMENRSMVTIGG